MPPQLRTDPGLVLRFGYRLTPPVVDLSIDDHAIAGTLTFSGHEFRCVLPWPAVYAVRGEGEPGGTVWPDNVPEDVTDGTAAPTPLAPEPSVDGEAAESRGHRHLRLVE